MFIAKLLLGISALVALPQQVESKGPAPKKYSFFGLAEVLKKTFPYGSDNIIRLQDSTQFDNNFSVYEASAYGKKPRFSLGLKGKTKTEPPEEIDALLIVRVASTGEMIAETSNLTPYRVLVGGVDKTSKTDLGDNLAKAVTDYFKGNTELTAKVAATW